MNVQARSISSLTHGLFAHLRLVAYESKVLKRETIATVSVGLMLLSLALIIGSRGFPTLVAWMVFENAAPLAMLFIVIGLVAQDRESRITERLFVIPHSIWAIYLRRLLVAFAFDIVVVLALAVLWQVKDGAPAVFPILGTSIPPILFLSSLGFVGALLLNDANGGALIGALWWLVHQFILRGWGKEGWFGYIFLFKETYYPNSPDLIPNRLTLLLLTAVLVGMSLFLLRKPERYL